MGKIITGIIGLFIIAAIGVFGYGYTYLKGFSEEDLQGHMTAALGRDVTIEGPLSISLLPAPAAQVAGLQIANTKGMKDPYFAKIGQASIGVELMPLLKKTVKVNKFILNDADIRLERKANGNVNWILGAPSDGSNETDQSDSTPAEAPIDDISLGDVRLINGAVTFRDGGSAQTFKAEKANLGVILPSLDEPLLVSGNMNFQGKPATLDARVTTPRALMNKSAASLKLDFGVESNSIDTLIDLGGGELNYTGRIDVNAPALRSLLGVLGMNISSNTGFNNLLIGGNVSGTSTKMSFDDAEFKFDEMTGRGKLDFDWSRKISKVTGDIDFDLLDLRPYLPEPPAAAIAAKKSKKEPFPNWSEEPIDFSFLKTIDADISGSTKGIETHDLTIGQSALKIDSSNGKLTAKLSETSIYDGGANGTIVVDARRNRPKINADFTMSGLNAKNFAADFFGMNRLAGVAKLNFDLSTSGNSQADFMRSLSGNGDFDLSNGLFEGVNLGQLVNSISSLVSSYKSGKIDTTALTSMVTSAQGATSNTEFEECAAGFTIRNGIVSSQNISVAAPFFSLAGSGIVNLPAQTVDITLNPTIVQSADRSTGEKLSAPIRISGTFNNPKVKIDTGALVKSAAEDKLRDVLRDQGIDSEPGQSIEDIAKDKARDAIGGLFGGKISSENEAAPTDAANDNAPDEEAPAEEEKSLEDQLKDEALNAIFGRKK